MKFDEVREEANKSREARLAVHRKEGGRVETPAEDRHEDKKLIDEAMKKDKTDDKKLIASSIKKTRLVEGRARGGKVDRPGKHGGKTNITIVMPPGGAGAGQAAGALPPRPPMPVAAAPPPGTGMPPRPIGGMAPMPPGAPPPGAMGGMPPRARGGRMTAGAGSGEGRIEKMEGKH